MISTTTEKLAQLAFIAERIEKLRKEIEADLDQALLVFYFENIANNLDTLKDALVVELRK